MKDEKWAFSLYEWFNTLVKEENYSKHGAAVKSKVESIGADGKPTGKLRPLTRERVGDVKEKYWKDMQEFGDALNIYAWWLGLVKWRDIASQLTQRIADRRDRLAPVLSETAFGADSGKEFDEL